jgi:hypothetical protein
LERQDLEPKKRMLACIQLDQAWPWQCVPGGMPGIHDHANRKMVKQHLPLLHQETSDGIQPEHGKENALLPKFQAYPIFHTRVAPDDQRIRNHPEMPRREEMLV